MKSAARTCFQCGMREVVAHGGGFKCRACGAEEPSAASVQVCMACGKVKGEHRGWDVSCEINSKELPESMLVRDPESGLVRQVKPEEAT